VDLIAATLDAPTALASEREFTTWRARTSGRPVVVTSTGIGGPSLSIAVEELAQLGVRTFVRVGTTGAIQRGIAPGDVVISTGAVRLDGASRHFASPEYPAVFYPGQERRDTYRGYVLPELDESLAMWRALGVLNYEMEAATLFVMAATMGLRAGAVSGVILNRAETESLADGAVAMAEQNAVLVATSAAGLLVEL
jgi:uridine phosphorylase